MTDLHPLWQVLIMAAVIAFTRFLPFLAFPEGRKRPAVITYLGKVLPYAIIGMLVVYCFKNVSVFTYPYGLPELIAAAFVVGMHVWPSICCWFNSFFERGIYMEIWELFLVAVSLSMDAFAVSVCKGLSVKKLRPRHCATAGLYFGGFQALMPLLGWLLGRQFESLIKSIDHWIAFVLLALIGANMIREALGDEEDVNDSFSFKTMLPLAVATSIDALAVGVTFAFLEVQILPAILLIGCTTFALGNVFGSGLQSKAEIAGGVILILLGIKILIEHLFFGG